MSHKKDIPPSDPTTSAETRQFYLEQYKMLRDEIMYYAREIYRTEGWITVMSGAVYSWILSHPNEMRQILPKAAVAVWFVPPGLIAIAAIRCLILIVRMDHIAGYLKILEQTAFGQDARLPGWESYKPRDRWIDLTDRTLATIMWTVMFGGTCVLSWFASR